MITNGWMDRWMDGGNFNIPFAFQVGIIKQSKQNKWILNVLKMNTIKSKV